MRQIDSIIRDKVGHTSGFKVPDGYFEALYNHVSENLPEPSKLEAPRVTKWHKFKPYLYLAAMFLGIWCMMKVFHSFSSDQGDVFASASPELIAQVTERQTQFDEIAPDYFSDDIQLEESVAGDYDSFAELQADLGYSLQPQYAKMKIAQIAS